MSTSAGACGAFGILLGPYSPEIVALREQLDAVVTAYDNQDGEPDDRNSPEEFPEAVVIQGALKVAFAAAGIIVPESAVLHWTGSDDDRPARCDADPNQWVLGFGLFTRPDQYPAMDPTFLANAQWNTWVWMG
jgi:hypothetical protein